MKDPRL